MAREQLAAGMGLRTLIHMDDPQHRVVRAIGADWFRPKAMRALKLRVDELAKIYVDAGLDGSKETVAYCRIGERSSHTWFVLQELLGHQNVKNYDGSWTEYGSLVGAPIELGS